MKKLRRYFWNILISVDQLINTLLGGDPDETISSRCGKYRHRKICRFICQILDKIEYRHCEKSIEIDEGKREVIRL
jgi:hypothetical protein